MINAEKLSKLIVAKQQPNLIKYMKDPSDLALETAILSDGTIIKNIENPSERQQLCAIVEDLANFKYIKNPTLKVKTIASVNEYNFKSIIKTDKIIDKQILKYALLENPEYIKFIPRNDISDDIIELILQVSKHNINHLLYIDNPPINYIKNHISYIGDYHLKQFMFSSKINNKYKLELIKHSPGLIRVFETQVYEFQKTALLSSKDIRILSLMRAQSKKLQKEILLDIKKNDKQSIYYKKNYFSNFRNPDREIIALALSIDGTNIRHIYRPISEEIIFALENNPLSLQYMNECPPVNHLLNALYKKPSLAAYIYNREVKFQLIMKDAKIKLFIKSIKDSKSPNKKKELVKSLINYHNSKKSTKTNNTGVKLDEK